MKSEQTKVLIYTIISQSNLAARQEMKKEL